MTWEAFFKWCDALPVAAAIRDSSVIFPVIESIHLLSLTVLLGTIVVLSILLFGSGLTGQPVALVARRLAPLTFWGLLMMVTTGALLFCSEAMKCYENPPFWLKMKLLIAAIVFHYTFVRRTAQADTPGKLRCLAAATGSLLLWFGVGAAGRAIGFY